MRREKKKQKEKRRKRILETLLSLAILLAIFLGGLTGYYGSKVLSFLEDISSDDVDLESPETIENTRQIEDLEPFAALILGTDIEEGGQARTDTIIVTTVNPNLESIKMVSVPRDTLITLPDGTIEKINAAYTTGGPQLSQEMVGEMFDIPIKFYAVMDFRGLIELVDAVGGITVDSDLAFTQNNFADPDDRVYIKEGMQRLNGEEALGYARMRKRDPRGDFGRQERQREVIVGVLDELVSFNTLTNLTDILNSIQPYLKTNATSRQMLGIASNYQGTLKDVEQLNLDGEADNEYFPHYGLTVYVWEPYDYSLEEISVELRNHLELEENSSKESSQNEANKEIILNSFT